MRSPSKPATRYALSVLASISSLGVTLLLMPMTGVTAFQILLLGVGLSALYLGRGSGHLTLGLSAIGSYILFIQSGRSSVAHHQEVVRWVLFVFSGVLLTWMGTRLRTSLWNECAARAKHRTAQAELEALLGHAPVGFAYFDSEHRYIRINEALVEINGIPEAVHIGRRIHDVLPFYAQAVDLLLDQVFKTGAPVQTEITGETPKEPGAERHWILGLYPVLETNQGKPITVGAYVIEITDRKRLEQQKEKLVREVSAQRAQLEAVLQQLPIGVGIGTPPSGMLVLQNDALRRIVNLKTEINVGPDKFTETFPARWPDGSTVENDQWPMTRALQGESVGPVEIHLIQKGTNQVRITRQQGQPVRDDQGRIIAAVVTVLDVTEERALQEELLRSQESLALALDAGSMGTWDWDLRAGRLRWNEMLQRIYGFRPGEWDERIESVFARLPSEDVPSLQAILRSIEDSGQEFSWEHRVLPPEGPVRWVYTRGKVLEFANGKPARMAGISIDVTERKWTEQRLATAIRARDESISILSHDLKNPLVSIDLNAALLGKKLGETAQDPVFSKQIATIRNSVSRMTMLISDMLDVSRIEAGRFDLSRQVHSVHKIVNDAIAAIAPIAESRGIRVEWPSPCADASVMCDEARISQVFANLLGNAVKFCPQGHGVIRVGCVCTHREVQFSIRDNGSGIPAENIPHIFDRFWHGRDTKRAGSGLGLSIAKGIVEAHGGRIEVTSRLHHGTTFRFVIPTLEGLAERSAGPAFGDGGRQAG